MTAEQFVKSHFSGIEKETWYPAIVAIAEGYGKNQYNQAIEDAQRKRYPHCWGKMTWILQYESGKEPADYVCSCQFGSRECLRLTRENAKNETA